MATIGLSKPFYAIYAASGATVSYTSGGVLGKAVELSMELDGGDANILYADNGPAESATTFGAAQRVANYNTDVLHVYLAEFIFDRLTRLARPINPLLFRIFSDIRLVTADIQI